jgi:hypothetical protein
VRLDSRAGGLTPAMRRRCRSLSAVLRCPDARHGSPAILVNLPSRPPRTAHPLAIPTATGPNPITALFLRLSRRRSGGRGALTGRSAGGGSTNSSQNPTFATADCCPSGSRRESGHGYPIDAILLPLGVSGGSEGRSRQDQGRAQGARRLVPLHRGFDGLKFNGGLGGPRARPEARCCGRRPGSA